MMTVDDKYLDRQFPKSVLLYFQHGNTLEYKKAVLYANLINCEEESSELFTVLTESRWSGLPDAPFENRRINDILHIIYKKRRCTERDMTPERIRQFMISVMLMRLRQR